jgi:hypothetical protein
MLAPAILGLLFWLTPVWLTFLGIDCSFLFQNIQQLVELKQRQLELEEQITLVMESNELKMQTTERLLRGSLTFEEAVNEFRRAREHSHRSNPHSEAILCRTVLRWAEGYLRSHHSEEVDTIKERLHQEAFEFLNRRAGNNSPDAA